MVGRAVHVALLLLVPAAPLRGQARLWTPPPADTARVVSLLMRAAALLGTTTDTASTIIRDEIARALLRAGAPDSARALTRTPRVLAATACVALQRGDTAGAAAVVRAVAPADVRDWALVQLAQRVLGPWWNQPPPPAAVAQADAFLADVAAPEPRAEGVLTLAHAALRAGDTAAARRRLALADRLVAASHDEIRRPALTSNLARTWIDAGNLGRGLALVATLSPTSQTFHLARVASERNARDTLAADSLFHRAAAAAMQASDSTVRAYALDYLRDVEEQARMARAPMTLVGVRAARTPPPPPPPVAPTLLDSARAAFLARDTLGAFTMISALPDPDGIGYRAAGYADLALMAQHHSDPAYWALERAAMRRARLAAAELRSPRVRMHVLRTILSHLEFYALADDTRRTPAHRALQESVVWDADSTAELMPAPARADALRGVAGTWATRHHLREALAVLARLPTRGARDSAAARILLFGVYDVASVVAVSDSLRLPSDTLPATTRAMRAARAVLLLNRGDTATARPFWTAALAAVPRRDGEDTLTVTRALYAAVRGRDVAAAEVWADRAPDPLTQAHALRLVADAVRSNGTGYPGYIGGGYCGEW